VKYPKRYYVYVHLNEHMHPFYVGCGSKKRVWDFKTRSNTWFKLAPKNPNVMIIKEGLSKRAAILLERAMICSYLTFGYVLANKLQHKRSRYL